MKLKPGLQTFYTTRPGNTQIQLWQP